MGTYAELGGVSASIIGNLKKVRAAKGRLLANFGLAMNPKTGRILLSVTLTQKDKNGAKALRGIGKGARKAHGLPPACKLGSGFLIIEGPVLHFYLTENKGLVKANVKKSLRKMAKEYSDLGALATAEVSLSSEDAVKEAFQEVAEGSGAVDTSELSHKEKQALTALLAEKPKVKQQLKYISNVCKPKKFRKTVEEMLHEALEAMNTDNDNAKLQAQAQLAAVANTGDRVPASGVVSDEMRALIQYGASEDDVQPLLQKMREELQPRLLTNAQRAAALQILQARQVRKPNQRLKVKPEDQLRQLLQQKKDALALLLERINALVKTNPSNALSKLRKEVLEAWDCVTAELKARIDGGNLAQVRKSWKVFYNGQHSIADIPMSKYRSKLDALEIQGWGNQADEKLMERIEALGVEVWDPNPMLNQPKLTVGPLMIEADGANKTKMLQAMAQMLSTPIGQHMLSEMQDGAALSGFGYIKVEHVPNQRPITRLGQNLPPQILLDVTAAPIEYTYPSGIKEKSSLDAVLFHELNHARDDLWQAKSDNIPRWDNTEELRTIHRENLYHAESGDSTQRLSHGSDGDYSDIDKSDLFKGPIRGMTGRSLKAAKKVLLGYTVDPEPVNAGDDWVVVDQDPNTGAVMEIGGTITLFCQPAAAGLAFVDAQLQSSINNMARMVHVLPQMRQLGIEYRIEGAPRPFWYLYNYRRSPQGIYHLTFTIDMPDVTRMTMLLARQELDRRGISYNDQGSADNAIVGRQVPAVGVEVLGQALLFEVDDSIPDL